MDDHGRGNGSNTRILVVDDDDLVRALAVDLLLEAGFAVDAAVNGQLALERVQDVPPGHYALILMDLNMPGMNGPAAIRTLAGLRPEQRCMLMSGTEEEREIIATLKTLNVPFIDKAELFTGLVPLVRSTIET